MRSDIALMTVLMRKISAAISPSSPPLAMCFEQFSRSSATSLSTSRSVRGTTGEAIWRDNIPES